MILNYKELKADLKTGNSLETLILIHGLFGSADNLTGPAKLAADAGYRVILPDLRNHGNSFRDIECGLFDMAGDILALADSLGVDDFHIAGHSLGGRVAMLAALLHPDRIKSIAILDIAPVTYKESHHHVFEALAAVPDSAGGAEARRFLSSTLNNPDLAGFLTKGYRDPIDRGQGFAFDHLSLHSNYPAMMLWPELSGICKAPGTAIYGGLSTYVTPDGEAAIKHFFPNLTLVKLENAGHMVHVEGGDLFIEAWKNYLV